MSNRFLAPLVTEYGIGATDKIGHFLKLVHAGKTLIVCDKGIQSVGLERRISQLVMNAGFESVTWNGVKPDPTVEDVRECTSFARIQKIDTIIALGGGSAIDTAKGVSLNLVLEGDIEDYLDFKKPIMKEGVPLIAIPTTSGTGSEVSSVAVLGFEGEDRKSVLMSPLVMPIASLVDANMSKSMPPHITAITGIDALTHALETYTTKTANIMSDSLALKAAETIIKNLPRVYERGNDVDARQAMAEASTMASIAFNSSQLHICHPMAEAIGAYWHIPHGICCAYTLVEGLMHQAEAVPDRMREIGRLFGVESAGDMEIKVLKKRLSWKINGFLRQFELPDIGSFEGVELSVVPHIADNIMHGMEEFKNSISIMPDRDEIMDILMRICTNSCMARKLAK